MSTSIMGDCYLCQSHLRRDELHAVPVYRRPSLLGKPQQIAVCADAGACRIRRNQREAARAYVAGRGVPV